MLVVDYNLQLLQVITFYVGDTVYFRLQCTSSTLRVTLNQQVRCTAIVHRYYCCIYRTTKTVLCRPGHVFTESNVL